MKSEFARQKLKLTFICKRKSMLLINFVFLANFSPAYSGQSLINFIEKVAAHNPQLRSAHFQIEEGKSHLTQVKWFRYPQFSLRTSYIRSNNPVYVFGSLLEQETFGVQNFSIESLNNPDYLTNIKNSLDLGFPVFMGYEISNEMKLRKLSLDQAKERWGELDQQIRFQALDAYLRVLLQTEIINRLSSRIKSSEIEVETAKRLNAKGLVLGSDYFASLALLNSLKAQKIQVQKDMEALSQQLREMMGGTSTVVVPEGALFIADYKIQSETELLRTAFSNQKNIKAAEISLAMANEELSQSGRSFLPKIEAFASLETNTRDFESNPNNRMIGVKSKFPLGDPAYFSRKSAAHAHRDAAQYQKESIEESIRVSVIQTLKRFEGARDSFLLLKEARDHALKSLELFRPLYREGRQSILDVLRAEDSLMRADQAMLENLYQIHLMYARLALVTGTLSSVTVQEIQKQIEINP